MYKKKFHGGLKLLLLLLFTMLLGICSTCYAEDNIWLLDDSDYFEWYYDYLLNNSNLNSTYKTRIQNIGKSSFGASFYNAWNSAMINKGFSNCLYTNCAIISRQTSSNLAFLLILHNAGSPGVLDLGFLYLWGDYVYGTYPNSGNIYLLKITIDSNGNIISNNTFETVSNTSSGSSQGSYSFNDDHSVLTLQNSGFAGIPQGYTKSDYINGNAQTVIFSSIGGNFIPSDSQPENPSGDSSGDIGGNTGTITNPSGDITGNIDLSGIENGITNINNNLNNIENKIPTSGDIQNAIGQATENYWGSSGDLTGDEQEVAIAENLNNIMTELSGEFSQNEVFTSLESAESGFLDLFRNEHEESYYDLAFEWEDFEYNGTTLIPGGSINISQMCRDNVQLGYIQSIIRVIFNFTVAFTLIYQIWNLILATLGIDNPYLYENYNEVDRLDPTTGEVSTRLYRKKRIFWR